MMQTFWNFVCLWPMETPTKNTHNRSRHFLLIIGTISTFWAWGIFILKLLFLYLTFIWIPGFQASILPNSQISRRRRRRRMRRTNSQIDPNLTTSQGARSPCCDQGRHKGSDIIGACPAHIIQAEANTELWQTSVCFGSLLKVQQTSGDGWCRKSCTTQAQV